MSDIQPTKSEIRNPKSEIPYYFCTYFDRNYLTRGLALYHSLRRHCRRPFILWVLCFDDETYDILSRLNLPGVRLISQQEFEAGDEGLIHVKANRSRVEYYWTCTPSLPLYVLQHNPEVELITYLDADLYFYSDPQPIFDELGDGSILIHEHRYAPQYVQLAATSGIYNVGWVSFRRDANGLACLYWWRERCLEWCYARYENGKFGDQLYLNDWPQRFPGVVVLQHPGAGLAPWNLCAYDVKFGQNRATVDGYPLIFYHFHAYQPIRRCIAQLSGPGYRISPQQVRHLYLPYRSALDHAQGEIVAAGWNEIDPPKHIGFSEVREGLLRRRFWLLEPLWLGVWLWRLNGWRETNWRLEEAAFDHFVAGDYTKARSLVLQLIRRNPLVLRRKSVVSMMLGNRRQLSDV